jgi:hypothetical protein
MRMGWEVPRKISGLPGPALETCAETRQGRQPRRRRPCKSEQDWTTRCPSYPDRSCYRFRGRCDWTPGHVRPARVRAGCRFPHSDRFACPARPGWSGPGSCHALPSCTPNRYTSGLLPCQLSPRSSPDLSAPCRMPLRESEAAPVYARHGLWVRLVSRVVGLLMVVSRAVELAPVESL